MARDAKHGLEDLREKLLAEDVEALSRLVDEALRANRHLFTEEIERQLREVRLGAAEHDLSPASSAEWIGIESLSRLRSVVGGRFQNLKQKWIEAGFPLREHRGDKQGEYELNQAGWLELSAWVLKQGFEARLPLEKDSPWLFEVRARASAK